MVLYDIACGLLSKSLSMGATYTLPMLCSLHLASFAFCLKILLLHSFYFIFPLGSDINCEPWAATTLPFLLQARGVPARCKRWTRARAWTWGVVEKLVSWIGSSRFLGRLSTGNIVRHMSSCTHGKYLQLVMPTNKCIKWTQKSIKGSREARKEPRSMIKEAYQ